MVFDWKGTIAVKRKKHHKRKKWILTGEEGGSKSEREASAVKMLEDRLKMYSKDVTQVEEKLELAEKEYEASRPFYTTYDFLLWFLEVKMSVIQSEKRREMCEVYMEEFLHKKWFREPPELYPGAVEVLQRLKKEGVKTALLRNGSLHEEGQRKILGYFGLAELFDIIICSSQLNLKSKEEMCDARLKKLVQLLSLNERNPAHILMVGNETNLDIKGGTNMGWQTCLMKTTEETSQGLATYEVESWLELANEVIWPRKFVKNKGTQSFEDSLKAVTEENNDINPFIQAVAGHRWQEGKQGFLKGGDKVYRNEKEKILKEETKMKRMFL